jgi:putative ABC transport system ATP-binding protein
VADERTSALEADARQAFPDLLFDHVDRPGSTLLMASHDRPLAARFDRKVALAECSCCSFHCFGSA